MNNEPGSNVATSSTSNNNNKSKSSKHLLQKMAMETSEKMNDIMISTKELISKIDVIVSNKPSVQDDTPPTIAFKKYEQLGKRQKVIENDKDLSPDAKEAIIASIKDQKKFQANLFVCKSAEKDKCDAAKDKYNVDDDEDSSLEEPSWMKPKAS